MIWDRKSGIIQQRTHICKGWHGMDETRLKHIMTDEIYLFLPRKNSGPNFLQELFLLWCQLHSLNNWKRQYSHVNRIIQRDACCEYCCFQLLCQSQIGMDFLVGLSLNQRVYIRKAWNLLFSLNFLLDKLHKLQQKVVRSKCVNQKVLKICHSETKKMLIYKRFIRDLGRQLAASNLHLDLCRNSQLSKTDQAGIWVVGIKFLGEKCIQRKFLFL